MVGSFRPHQACRGMPASLKAGEPLGPAFITEQENGNFSRISLSKSASHWDTTNIGNALLFSFFCLFPLSGNWEVPGMSLSE